MASYYFKRLSQEGRHQHRPRTRPRASYLGGGGGEIEVVLGGRTFPRSLRSLREFFLFDFAILQRRRAQRRRAESRGEAGREGRQIRMSSRPVLKTTLGSKRPGLRRRKSKNSAPTFLKNAHSATSTIHVYRTKTVPIRVVLHG